MLLMTQHGILLSHQYVFNLTTIIYKYIHSGAVSVQLFIFHAFAARSVHLHLVLELDVLTVGCRKYPKIKSAYVMKLNHCSGKWEVRLDGEDCKQHL